MINSDIYCVYKNMLMSTNSSLLPRYTKNYIQGKRMENEVDLIAVKLFSNNIRQTNMDVFVDLNATLFKCGQCLFPVPVKSSDQGLSL